MKFFLKLKENLIRFLEQKIYYYTNAYECLPSPLSKEEEDECIRQLDFSDSAKDMLIEHNLRLVVYIARKFDSPMYNLEDMISIGTIGLIKAVNTYKPDKSIKLATYASKCIENEILMYIRKNSKRKCEISLDEPLNYDADGNELILADVICSEEAPISYDMEKESELQMLSNVLDTLEESEFDIINMRFGINGQQKKTQKEVADKYNISQSYISRLEKKIVFNLRKEMIKLLK